MKFISFFSGGAGGGGPTRSRSPSRWLPAEGSQPAAPGRWLPAEGSQPAAPRPAAPVRRLPAGGSRPVAPSRRLPAGGSPPGGSRPAAPWYHAKMRLRTRLNLVVAGLSAAFVIVLIAAEIQGMRDSVREETEAANRVASLLLGRLRANEVYLLSGTGETIYRSPEASYKAGRQAPPWFARLLAPESTTETFALR